MKNIIIGIIGNSTSSKKKKEWTHKKKTHKRGIRRENKTQDIAIRDKEMENVKKWKKRQRVTIKWKTTYV